MADGTGIEWTHRAGTKGETWNPIVGCSIATAGCINCYAMKMAARIEAIDAAAGRSSHYAGTTKKVKGKPVWTGKIGAAPDYVLTAPLRWRTPRTVFVNSMSDLFHENVPDEWIDRVFAVMALSPQHTFQVLTKRAKRMREYFDIFSGADPYRDRIKSAMWTLSDCRTDHVHGGWPLRNVWLGISAERQQEADERIPHLLATPAAIRFVSAEPLLGPIDFHDIPWPADRQRFPETDDISDGRSALWTVEGTRLDWIIVGGESGNGARPMHQAWARSIRDQCAAAGVPFFFKQWGEWAPGECISEPVTRTEDIATWWEGGSTGPHWQYGRLTPRESEETHVDDQPDLYRVGKKRAGRLLDGVEHNGFPTPHP